MNVMPTVQAVPPTAQIGPAPATPSSNLTHHIPFLDGLRGFAALWVMIGHARSEAMTTGLKGPLLSSVLWHINEGWGVPVFIVLSGFLLTSPLVDKTSESWRGAWPFMLRRARRIYPAYLATIVLVLALVSLFPLWSSQATARWRDALPITPTCLADHLLLIHYWFVNYAHKIDPPMWSLAVEWQIYILFAVLLVPVLFARGLKAFWIVGSLAALAISALNREFGLLTECFVLGGVGAFVAFSRRPAAERLRTSKFASFLCPALFLIAFLMGVKINYLPECCIGLGSVLLLIQLSSTQNAGPLLRTIRAGLASRAGRLVGWFSYSLYLLHFVVISGVNSAAISAGVSPSTRTILLLVVAPALSLFLAYVFAWMFEYRLTPKSKRST